MQDFKNKESAKQHSLLRDKLKAIGPIGKLIKR